MFAGADHFHMCELPLAQAGFSDKQRCEMLDWPGATTPKEDAAMAPTLTIRRERA
jgi:hypothetical protein